MNVVFNPETFRRVKYRFEKEDKIVLRGVEYRFIRHTSEGVCLQRLDGDYPLQLFEHAAIWRMLAIGQLRVIRASRSLPAPEQRAEGEETQLLVDLLHNTPHEGLAGKTPLEAWEELVERWGVLPPPDLRARRLTRKVQRTGIHVLGVTYTSEALQRWRLHARKHEVPVRWHPDDIGCIEVKFDGAWREVGAVAEAFHGRTAQEWIAAARQIRASNQSRAAVNEDIVLQAFADIDAIAGAAMKRADILVDTWSPERLQSLEDRLFIGFQVAATPVVGAPEPTPRTILGTLIPVGGDVEQVSPMEDDTESAASATDAVEDIDDEDDGWGIDR